MIHSRSICRLFFILGSLQFYAVQIQGQGVQFQSDLDETFTKASQEGKSVFIEYYSSSCPICKELEPLFEDIELGEFYNANFVSYQLNVGEYRSMDSLFIAQTGLYFTSVPYLLFFDQDRQFLHYSDAKAEVGYLIQAGSDALHPEKRAAALEGKYKKGDRSLRTLYAYSLLAKLQNRDSLRRVLADEIYTVFPKSDLGTQKSYIITKNCVTTIENGFFTYWMAHLDELQGFESGRHIGKEKERIAEILRGAIYSEARKQWSLEKIAEVKDYVRLTGLSSNPDAFFWEQETAMLIGADRFTEAKDIGGRMYYRENAGLKSRIHIIRHFLKALSTPEDVQAINIWMEEAHVMSGDLRDQADLMYLNALFYTKSDQPAEASNAITQAFSFFKEHSFDTAELDELIE